MNMVTFQHNYVNYLPNLQFDELMAIENIFLFFAGGCSDMLSPLQVNGLSPTLFDYH